MRVSTSSASLAAAERAAVERMGRIMAPVRIFKEQCVTIMGQTDNASDVNAMSIATLRDSFPNLHPEPLSDPRDKEVAGMGGSASPLGQVELAVFFGKRAMLARFLIFSDGPTLLGNALWPALGLGITGAAPFHDMLENPFRVNSDRPEPEGPLLPSEEQLCDLPREIVDLLSANAAISPDATCSHPMATVRVDVPPGTRPIYVKPRRVDQVKHVSVEEQVKEWLSERVVETCQRASPWNCALVVVDKRDSKGQLTGYRVCIDPRHINRLTPDEGHPLPHIIDHLDEACGAKVFSSLDLKGSFHQFNVEPSHRDFLAFTWNNVQYRFRRGPFGLKALAAQFQRVMSEIFSDLHFVRVYIDDLVVFSQTVEEHAEHLAEVLRRLNKFSLRLKPAKCCFFRRAIAYLGHVISDKGF